MAVGDTLRLMPGYSPTTVNFYDCYYVAEDEHVIDVWPVLGRYGTETTGVGQ
jgi:D-serine deaminase-like pyridoxal phosphate-dependent protein